VPPPQTSCGRMVGKPEPIRDANWRSISQLTINRDYTD
jgi:hypothetical protein